MSKSILPDDYSPYQKMIICGNSFVEGTVPVAIDGHPLFLIGRGGKVWLQVRSGKGEWEFVITPSEITDSAFEVTRSGRSIAVYFGPHLLIQANEESEALLMINHLDFSPIGFSIYGTPTELKVGGMQFSSNSFKRVHTMVNVG